MSQAATVTKSQAPTQSHEIQPTTTPIVVLQSPSAQALSHAQPLILACYFYLRFHALVIDPISTLSIDVLPVAVVQCIYAVVCLPLSKRSASEQPQPNGSGEKSKKKTKSSRVSQDAELGSRISNALISILLTIASTIPVFVLLVLFGAPLTTHHAQTMLCATHLSFLAVFPLFYTHGVDKQAWWEIGGAMLPFDSVWGTTIGTVLGAWLGAVPIPLDWDREWQKWPVTIIAGMYAGALMGNYAGRYLFHGKRIKFAPANENDKDEVKKNI